MAEQWSMSGALLSCCNCDWGCPCNFNVPPTYGHCEGAYLYAVKEGHHGDTSLEGVNFAWIGYAPGPFHEGNLRSLWVLDSASSAEQQSAIYTLSKGDGVGEPFDIYAAITGTWLETIVAPFEVEVDGMRSKARIDGGKVLELELARTTNPVTGEEEEMYLDKRTGFTSQLTELGTTTVAAFTSEGLSFEQAGKYGEFADFEYSGP